MWLLSCKVCPAVTLWNAMSVLLFSRSIKMDSGIKIIKNYVSDAEVGGAMGAT